MNKTLENELILAIDNCVKKNNIKIIPNINIELKDIFDLLSENGKEEVIKLVINNYNPQNKIEFIEENLLLDKYNYIKSNRINTYIYTLPLFIYLYDTNIELFNYYISKKIINYNETYKSVNGNEKNLFNHILQKGDYIEYSNVDNLILNLDKNKLREIKLIDENFNVIKQIYKNKNFWVKKENFLLEFFNLYMPNVCVNVLLELGNKNPLYKNYYDVYEKVLSEEHKNEYNKIVINNILMNEFSEERDKRFKKAIVGQFDSILDLIDEKFKNHENILFKTNIDNKKCYYNKIGNLNEKYWSKILNSNEFFLIEKIKLHFILDENMVKKNNVNKL